MSSIIYTQFDIISKWNRENTQHEAGETYHGETEKEKEYCGGSGFFLWRWIKANPNAKRSALPVLGVVT